MSGDGAAPGSNHEVRGTGGQNQDGTLLPAQGFPEVEERNRVVRIGDREAIHGVRQIRPATSKELPGHIDGALGDSGSTGSAAFGDHERP